MINFGSKKEYEQQPLATIRDMLVKPLVLASLCSANQYLNLFKFHTDTAKMSSRLRISQH